MSLSTPSAQLSLLQPVLKNLTEAIRLLAECKSFDEAKHYHDLAEAARQYAKVSGLGLEAQNHATEIKLRAERRMGEMLRESGIHPGQPKKNGNHAGTILFPSLREIDVTKRQSSQWQTIATLPKDQFETYIEDTRSRGQELTSIGALRLVRQQQKVADIQKRQGHTAALFDANQGDFYTTLDPLLADGQTFGCLYADPPWAYSNQATRASTHNHYSTMSVDEICALPIGELAARESHLHLWTTNAFLFECPRIFAAWGFEFKSSFVWVKPQMGIGNYWRNSHELLLLGIRGGLRGQHHGLQSWLEAPRGEHSRKPERIRDLIEQLSPGPYLELFGRSRTPGWSVWGNECVPKDGRLFKEVVSI